MNWEKELFCSEVPHLINKETYWHGSDSEKAFYENKAYKREWTATDITYKFNEYGFRSKSFLNLADDKDKLRILVTGCSHTVGVGNKLEDTWPVILSNKISNSVLYNLAQGGMSPDYCVRSVYKTIDIFNPDIVLVLWPDKSRFEWPTQNNNVRFYVPSDDDYPLLLTDSYFQDYVFQKNKIMLKEICKNIQYYSLNFEDTISTQSQGRDLHFGLEFHKTIADSFYSLLKQND
jgi:hypothetical protein